MTEVVLYKTSDSGVIRGFRVSGHSGFAVAGEDIVCAAISMLVINTMNSIEKFTDDRFDASMDDKDTVISFDFKDDPSERSTLLIDSMILGLKTVQKNYGKEFLDFIEKEV